MRTIAVITGSRADFGLLKPVMHAIGQHPALEMRVIACGAHLLPPALTIQEVESAFPIAQTIAMQVAGVTGRMADADALGRGVSGMASYLAHEETDVVLVLGDRIEAFAAAAAASVAGIRVAHSHGGDRAEGTADEAMRHAITKLAHIHLPASAAATERLIAMGEEPLRTHLVGSPAIDGLEDIPPLSDHDYESLGRPQIVFLLHPTGENSEVERERAAMALGACMRLGPTFALMPNHDPGREGIVGAIANHPGVIARDHLPRDQFIGLLKRASMIVGNSSAGLIECAAIPLRCVNLGSRQGGRDRDQNVINCLEWTTRRIEDALERGWMEPVLQAKHPWGDGHAGDRIAAVLATFIADNHSLTKRNTY